MELSCTVGATIIAQVWGLSTTFLCAKVFAWRKQKMLEKQIEGYLVKKVKEIGGVAYKFVSPANRGVADRIVCLPDGGVVFVEVKSATGQLSALQEQFAKDMTRLKQNYIVLKSREEVNALIEIVSKQRG